MMHYPRLPLLLFVLASFPLGAQGVDSAQLLRFGREAGWKDFAAQLPRALAELRRQIETA